MRQIFSSEEQGTFAPSGHKVSSVTENLAEVAEDQPSGLQWPLRGALPKPLRTYQYVSPLISLWWPPNPLRN